MPKYECRTCKNTFIQATTANRQCPNCRSNNIFELWDEPSQQNFFMENLGIIVSCAVIVLMLIVLFVLPYVPNRYLASVVAVPESCGFSINVTDYGYPVDSSMFQFSIDNGKNWNKTPRFAVKTPGVFEIKVKAPEKERDTICYAFSKQYSYKPAASCMPAPADPCDCKNLRVASVEKSKISGHDVLVVHVSQPKCGIEYSISGIHGKYQEDSVFSKFTPKDSIFVKSAKCNPVGYTGNPFVAANPVVVVNDKPHPVSSQRLYKESEVEPKPYPSLYENRDELIRHLTAQIQDFGPHGVIEIAFTVETMGSLTKFQNINNVSQALNERVIRAINKLGNWTAGYKGNNPVDTYVVLRIPAN